MEQLEIKDSVLDPDSHDPKIWFQTPKPGEKRTLYRAFLYLDGPFLPYVQSATYQLHETFQDRVRTVPRTAANPRCKLEIWTWGLFEVIAEIKDKRGQSSRLSHWMSYDREIEKSDAKNFQAVA